MHHDHDDVIDRIGIWDLSTGRRGYQCDNEKRQEPNRKLHGVLLFLLRGKTRYVSCQPRNGPELNFSWAPKWDKLYTGIRLLSVRFFIQFSYCSIPVTAAENRKKSFLCPSDEDKMKIGAAKAQKQKQFRCTVPATRVAKSSRLVEETIGKEKTNGEGQGGSPERQSSRRVAP